MELVQGCLRRCLCLCPRGGCGWRCGSGLPSEIAKEGGEAGLEGWPPEQKGLIIGDGGSCLLHVHERIKGSSEVGAGCPPAKVEAGQPPALGGGQPGPQVDDDRPVVGGGGGGGIAGEEARPEGSCQVHPVEARGSLRAMECEAVTGGV
jgi:hypothetical protein